GADGVSPEVASAAVGNDTNSGVAEVPEKAGVGLAEVEDDGGGVGRIDAGDVFVGAGFDGDDGSVEDGVERPLYVARSEGAAILKMHPGAEMKDVGEGVGDLPACGEIGIDAEMVVALYERVEDEGVDALGLGVGADARVEAVGAALDEYGCGVGWGMV